MTNNVKMRSKDTKGNTIEVIDKSKKVTTITGVKLISKYQVLCPNYTHTVESFTEAKNIFKWALNQ